MAEPSTPEQVPPAGVSIMVQPNSEGQLDPAQLDNLNGDLAAGFGLGLGPVLGNIGLGVGLDGGSTSITYATPVGYYTPGPGYHMGPPLGDQGAMPQGAMPVAMGQPQQQFGPPPGHPVHPGHQAMGGPYGQPQQQFGMPMGRQPGDELNLSQLQQLQHAQHAAARHHHHQQRQHQIAAMRYQQQHGHGGDGDATGIPDTASLEGIPTIGPGAPMAQDDVAAVSTPVGGPLSPLPAAIKPPGAAIGIPPGSPSSSSDVVISTLPAELGIDLPALLQPGTEHPLTTYNTAIHGCANAKPALVDEAVGLLKRITSQGLEPDMVTYNAMIKAAANARPARVDVAMDMLSRLSWQGIKPDQRLYNSIIQACANAQPAAVDDALGTLQRMQAQGLEPNQVTYATVITACANANPARVDQAMTMLERMTSEGIEPDQIVFATVIKTCANAMPARVDAVMNVLAQMAAQGLEPNQATFNSVINACANAQPTRVDDAMGILKRMTSRGLIPDQITYSSVINACAIAQPARVEEAMAMLKRMIGQGILPNYVTYSTLINACANSVPARVEDGLDVMRQMAATGVEPEQISYATVIKACAYTKPAKLTVALAVLDQMIKYGCSVNGIILSTLLNTCTYARPPQPLQAEQLFRTFIPHGTVHLDPLLEKALRKAVPAAVAAGLIQWATESFPQCLQPPYDPNNPQQLQVVGQYEIPAGGPNQHGMMDPNGMHGLAGHHHHHHHHHGHHMNAYGHHYSQLPGDLDGSGMPGTGSRFGFAYEDGDGLEQQMGSLSMLEESMMQQQQMGLGLHDGYGRYDLGPMERTKKVFAGGLPPHATEETVKESFSRYGNVTEVLLMYDRKMQRFRGFGYITFDSADHVESLCQQRFVEIDGKQVEIKAAQPKAAMDAQRKITSFRGPEHTLREAALMKTKKVFCGGLPPSTTEESIKAVFEQFGVVTEVLLMYDKLIMGDSEVQRFRGFGYITFDSTEPVDALCRQRFMEVDGKQVEIKAAQPKAAMDAQKKLAVAAALDAHRQMALPRAPAMPRTKKIFCGGLPPSTTEESVKAVFNQFGEVTEVLLMYDRELQRFRGFGYITFSSEEPVEMLCRQHYIEVGGKQVEIKAAQPKVQMEAQRMLGAQRGRDSGRRNGRNGGDRRGRSHNGQYHGGGGPGGGKRPVRNDRSHRGHPAHRRSAAEPVVPVPGH